MRRIAVAVCVLCLSCGATAQSSAGAVFSRRCASCHGDDGKGGKSTKMHVPDLRSNAVQQMTDEELYLSIAKGAQHKEYPHAYEYQGVSKQQIRALVEYIRGLAKNK